MNKLIPLMLLLLVSFKSFSQTDTIVSLKEPIARLVIKDLVKGDGTLIELKQTQELLILEQKKVVLKDSVIGNLTIKIVNLESIISKKDEQFGLERQKSESLVKELKREKRKTFFYKLGTYAAGVVTILYLSK